MDSKRILIVEPDSSFALSLAALFQEEGQSTGVAASAADAEREMAARRPQLLVLRAELPDLSGFSLCARLRHDPDWAQLPIILFSSETSQEVLSDHARTSTAASGYFGMPLDTHALTSLARQLLASGEPDEIEDDELIEIVEEAPIEVRIGEEPQPQEVAAAEEEPVPPPVPQRPQRTSITDEDRLFVDRVFQSISERQADLIAESLRRRPPPRRDLLATPEGRLQLVREDLRWREAQLARLSEIWGVRERQLVSIDDRLHERDVQIQSLKLQIEDLLRRLGEARDSFLEKEREHGASLEGLLLEKFSHEKELIEVVAASERRIHELEREIRVREDDLANRKIALDAASEEIARLEREGKAEAARGEAREKELEESLANRGAQITALESSLAENRQAQVETQRVHDEQTAAAEAAHRALEQELSTTRAEREEAIRALERKIAEAEERARGIQTQLDDARTAAAEAWTRSEAHSAEMQQALTALETERDHLLTQAQLASQAYQTRIDEREATIREREEQLRLRDEEHRKGHEEARRREEDLSREIREHLQQIGSLEGELEAAGAELAEREGQFKAEAEALQAELERERQERANRESSLGAAVERAERLGEELEAIRRESQQLARQAEENRSVAATREAELSISLEEERRRAKALEEELAVERGQATTRITENEGLRQQIEAAHAEAVAAGEEVRRIGAQVAGLQEEKAKLEADRESLRSEAEAERTRYAEADERARAEISVREEKLNRLDAAAKTQSDHVAELERELAAREERLRGLIELQARVARAETRAAELAARTDTLNRERQTAFASHQTRVAELERTLEQANSSRTQLERELRARVIAAEAQTTEVNQRLERLLEEQRDLEVRQLQTLNEARTRQAGEAQAREQSLADEIEHLRNLLQERARQAKLLELEAQRLRGQPQERALGRAGARPSLAVAPVNEAPRATAVTAKPGGESPTNQGEAGQATDPVRRAESERAPEK